MTAHDTRGPLTPYIAVAGARRAIDWYRGVLGARLTGDPVVMPDGRVGHAEVRLSSGAVLMLSEEHPEIGVTAPGGQGTSVTLHLEVGDVDAVIDRAVAAGAACVT